MSDKEYAKRIAALEAQVERLTGVLDEIIARNIPVHLLTENAFEHKRGRQRPASLLFNDNFYLPNSYSCERSGGRTFKWLGPHPVTTIPIQFERSINLDMHIHLVSYKGTLETLAQVILSVDGEVLPHRIDQGSDGNLSLKLEVPATRGPLFFPVFLLVIEYPSSFELSDNDKRLGTLGISRIDITPQG